MAITFKVLTIKILKITHNPPRPLIKQCNGDRAGNLLIR